MTNDDRITEAVKAGLQDYEPSFDASGWNRLEKELNATAPAVSSQSITKWTFSLNTIVGTSILAGGLLVAYIIAGSSKVDSASAEKNSLNNTNANEALITNPDQEDPKPLTDVIAESEALLGEQPETTAAREETVVTESALPKKEEKKTGKKPKNEKPAIASTSDSASGPYDFMKAQEPARIKVQVPAFGDQIDPAYGFIKNTNEDENIRRRVEKTIQGGESDAVLENIKHDSLLNNKIIGATEEKSQGKKSKKKKGKNKNEQAPANTSIEKENSVKPN